MKLLLIVFILSAFTELLLSNATVWRFRRPIVTLTVLLSILACALFLLYGSLLWLMPFVFITGYRLINLTKILLDRLESHYLRAVTMRTSRFILVLLILLLLLNILSSQLFIDWHMWLWVISILQFLAAIIVVYTVTSNTKAIKQTTKLEHIPNHLLPSVSVAIPARDETSDLEQCLNSILLSDYPKLEILVLDDNSQSTRTSEIIRGYAHNGVRFIAGKAPDQNWLAKNYAYQQLSEQASGEIILFCGVDSGFGRSSITQAVGFTLNKNISMLGLIPINKPPSDNIIQNISLQPLRYAWELAWPRKLLNQPPILSTTWMIKSHALANIGGFASNKHAVLPEHHFAQLISNRGEGYSFVESTNEFASISTQKTIPQQKSTAIRTKYPLLHRRPEYVALFVLLELLLLVGPFIITIFALVTADWIILLLALITFALQTTAYANLVRLTYRTKIIWAYYLLPIACLYDVWLINLSMWRYEFGAVYWKGRMLNQKLLKVGNLDSKG